MEDRPKPTSLDNPLDDMLGYQLRRASIVTLSALTEDFDALGLRLTDAVILRFVAANPGCNQGEISRALGVKRTNMVPIVGGLVDRGLIDRAVADGRSNALTLTEKGAEIHHKIVNVGAVHERRFFGDFDDATRTIMMQALRAIRAKSEN